MSCVRKERAVREAAAMESPKDPTNMLAASKSMLSRRPKVGAFLATVSVLALVWLGLVPMARARVGSDLLKVKSKAPPAPPPAGDELEWRRQQQPPPADDEMKCDKCEFPDMQFCDPQPKTHWGHDGTCVFCPKNWYGKMPSGPAACDYLQNFLQAISKEGATACKKKCYG